ncbi:formyltransferase family protein [Candidatus Marinarcus aquaticus]|uniref:Formyl transferase n=1 Tax=Candidatus Marinarcus aquaticus TaxID=2044504 RepID=A0A4Q0XNI8_9BACT|nr:formyltransferase family protein [Candidatus Marinarcus aquaticus]RXJ55371.1 formyl transferase [Candidatus Marinarcus aquaticus]
MKIVFIGTVDFSLQTLEKLIDLNANIVGVCTKESSSFNSDFANLQPLCQKHHIPCHCTEDVNTPQSIAWIKSLQPDIVFCFGWSNLIKKELLELPALGVLGFHPTKLPLNRGRHPIIWSLALGLKQSATTFFFMDEGADSGDILSQKEFDISDHDDAYSLYKKITLTALSQIEEFLPQLEQNSYVKTAQDHSKANYWRKRGKNDGKIDFRMNSLSIYNLVRALSKPYVGAHLVYNNTDIPVWKVEILDYKEPRLEPGKVLSVENNCIIVKTNDGAVKILEHEFTTLPKIGEYL